MSWRRRYTLRRRLGTLALTGILVAIALVPLEETVTPVEAANCGLAKITFYKNSFGAAPSRTFCYGDFASNFTQYTWSDGTNLNDSVSAYKYEQFYSNPCNLYLVKMYSDAWPGAGLMYQHKASYNRTSMGIGYNDAMSQLWWLQPIPC